MNSEYSFVKRTVKVSYDKQEYLGFNSVKLKGNNQPYHKTFERFDKRTLKCWYLFLKDSMDLEEVNTKRYLWLSSNFNRVLDLLQGTQKTYFCNEDYVYVLVYYKQVKKRYYYR